MYPAEHAGVPAKRPQARSKVCKDRRAGTGPPSSYQRVQIGFSPCRGFTDVKCIQVRDMRVLEYATETITGCPTQRWHLLPTPQPLRSVMYSLSGPVGKLG